MSGIYELSLTELEFDNGRKITSNELYLVSSICLSVACSPVAVGVAIVTYLSNKL